MMDTKTQPRFSLRDDTLGPWGPRRTILFDGTPVCHARQAHGAWLYSVDDAGLRRLGAERLLAAREAVETVCRAHPDPVRVKLVG